MKAIFIRVVIIILFCSSVNRGLTQTLPVFDLIKLEKTSDYRKAEPFVLQTANYLLATPFKSEKPDRLKSIQFLIGWMTGTPDYSFTLDETTSKIFKGNDDILGIYLAALAKYALENKDSAKDAKHLKLNAVILLLNYCENKNNNMRMTKQLKKLSEARASGKLEEAL